MINEFEKITSILLDFGGVLYQINEHAPLLKFKELSKNKSWHANSKIRQIYENTLFVNFQKGILNPTQFRKQLKIDLSLECSDIEFDKAWNSILVSLYPSVFEYLRELKENNRIFLISNTNAIHYKRFYPECRELFEEFERCYFSHFTGYNKPEPEFYKYVLQENSLKPSESLLIDDSEININSARGMGINVFHIKSNGIKEFMDYIQY